MPVPEAKNILGANLPDKEFVSIFYPDIHGYDLNYIADTKLYCSESMVKKYRRRGYNRLEHVFFKK